MPFDLALSEFFDVLVTGSRDVSGVDGDALIAQRIKLRLRIPRGSWVLDDTGDLGSYIHQYFGSPASQMLDHLPQLIRQALADMEEVEITDVQVEVSTIHEVIAKIFFRHLPDTGTISSEASSELGLQEVTVQIGTGG